MVDAAIIERAEQVRKTPILDRIRGMRELFAQAGDEAQQIRHLPAWASKSIADEGLYRFALPHELGGEDTRCREQIEAVAAVSAVDGSVGWCVHINSEINSLILRQMTAEAEEAIYGDWYVLTCGGVGPGLQNAIARPEGDGWRLWCQGSFGSGCHNATYTLVHTGNVGVPSDGGKSSEKAFLIPRENFEIVDTWDTAGLRGSGSHDVKVDGAFIPEPFTLPMELFAGCERYANPTFRNPTQAHYNKGAVAIGICRGAIDELTELAQTKTPWGSGSMLKDQPEAPIRIAEAEATLAAARAFLIGAEEELEDHLGPLPAEGGRVGPEWEPLRRALLSCVHAAQSSMHIVDVIHNTAGTTASRIEHPLERKLRDAHQAAAHAAISWRHYRSLGLTYMTGEAPEVYTRNPRA